MITLLFIFLAAFFDAISDAVENEHISLTVFGFLPPKFWSKRESWKYVKHKFSYPIDAWHLSKSYWIICMVLAIVFYSPIVNTWVDFFLYGFMWNFSFNMFYSQIFLKDNPVGKIISKLLGKLTPKYLL